MASGADDFYASCCGGCCLACTAALDSWCMQKSYGSGGSNRQAGCCTRCCGHSFDEDEFNPAQNGSGPRTAAQPAPQQSMSTDKPAVPEPS
ncbi:hypothetical protein BC628DRAFT_1369228 [Trametes gibbosa]|nr:hypothetical protein BC628DRAFT_1369228 [Trametes gibbosa]